MIMKNYIKYISLGTAAMLLNSYNVNAGIREDLLEAKTAFDGLKDTPDNWQEVAQKFIDVFDTLNNKLIGIAEANGGKNYSNSFIDPIQWKNCRIVEDWAAYFFMNDGKYSDRKLKDNIAKPLMVEICKEVNGEDVKEVTKLKEKIEKKGRTLTTKDLKSLKSKYFKKALANAGELWINNFVMPVGVLLKTYSQKKNNNVEQLQLLLNLWRCYRSCEMIIKKEPTWATNFKDAYAAFGSYLAFTITTCKEEEESKKEICCDLLNQDPSCSSRHEHKSGCEVKYNFNTEYLVNWIGTKKPVCKEIEEALGNAKKIVAYWDGLNDAYKQGSEFGFGTRMGFGY